MATSRQALVRTLLLAATLAVVFVGSADAWYKCPSGYADCKPRVPGCETCIFKDPFNCGKCGNCCKQVPNAVTPCRYGKCCPPTCKPGYGDCDHNIWKNGCEKSLLSDPFNCGKCGYCCPQYPNAISPCKYGKCCPPVCKPGFGDCDGKWNNGCEKSLLSDPFNCGKCGYCCPQYPNAISPCKYGKCCPPVCKPGYGDCDGKWNNGCEKSLLSDPFNCGKCGYCCPQYPNAITPCNGGKCCPPVCKPGYGDCDGKWNNGCEKSLLSDPFNCGKCGYCCPQYPNAITPCNGGKCCPPVCKPGYGDCDGNWQNGCEKSLLSDPFNCGKCGYCCPQYPNAFTPCNGGKCCPPICKPGYGDCDGDWTNGCEKSLLSDIFNCGKCGNCCKLTLKGGYVTCSGGVCGQQCSAGSQYDSSAQCCVPIPPPPSANATVVV